MFRHHSTGIALVVALALAAAAPSVASARPFEPIAPPATSQAQASPAINPHSGDAANPAVRAIQAQGARVAHALLIRDARTSGEIVNPTRLLTVTVFQPNGFDWGDAGIGAGTTLGLSLILLGSTLYLTHRHTARVSQPR